MTKFKNAISNLIVYLDSGLINQKQFIRAIRYITNTKINLDKLNIETLLIIISK